MCSDRPMRPKFEFAFERPALLQGDPSMVPPSSATSPVTQKNVIGLSVLFLVLAGIFGALNSHKVKALRANVANAEALRRAVGSRSVTQQRDLKTKETTATGEENKIAEAENKIAEAENKAAKAEAERAQLQKEKADLQTRLDANQSEIASLQKRVEEAEKEKAFWSEKLQSAQERSAPPQEERKRRETGVRRTGVRGTVLAVNQAY